MRTKRGEKRPSKLFVAFLLGDWTGGHTGNGLCERESAAADSSLYEIQIPSSQPTHDVGQNMQAERQLSICTNPKITTNTNFSRLPYSESEITRSRALKIARSVSARLSSSRHLSPSLSSLRQTQPFHIFAPGRPGRAWPLTRRERTSTVHTALRVTVTLGAARTAVCRSAPRPTCLGGSLTHSPASPPALPCSCTLLSRSISSSSVPLSSSHLLSAELPRRREVLDLVLVVLCFSKQRLSSSKV